tara:strand:- start:91138 stop:94233 length:3096 start_codon:yes stop_codon:yes gene_type:complete
MDVPPIDEPLDRFEWLDPTRFRRPEQAREDLSQVWRCGATPDLLIVLRDQLIKRLPTIDDVDSAVSNLARFVLASRSPASLLGLFERDTEALPHLLQLFSTSQSLANRVISDPESFDLLRASDGQPADRKFLVDELAAEIDSVDHSNRASMRIRKFVMRENARIAYGEFVRGVTPDRVGRELAHVADAAIEAALRFADRQLTQRRGKPKLADGSTSQVTVIGLGTLGGEELGYGDPLPLIFLFDRIDYLNKWHRDYYTALVAEVISILCSDQPSGLGYSIDSRVSPMFETGTLICSVRDAVRIYESSGQTWQRLNFVKARTVAGSSELGDRFLDQLQPWIYRRHISREGLSAFASVREKLQRRTNPATHTDDKGANRDIDIQRDPGGRQDIELTVQFVQLLHGGDLDEVRVGNTVEAIIALERSGCLTHQEATLLAENYARLCRLQHQLSVMFDTRDGQLPRETDMQQRLAYQLGIRNEVENTGDIDRFHQMLNETLGLSRKIINHLLLDTPESDGVAPVETALVLDPDPDSELVRRVLSKYQLRNPVVAMQQLHALSRETVSFLSPQRCRQFFSALAPALLTEIASTPDPDRTLASLVAVADSLGAKATLWELLRVNRPTMQLVVRLCAAAPYLSRILKEHPGMIDELIDSLLMNRLPSRGKIEAQSIELCRGAHDRMLILENFKNSMHLTIGVRDILGKETIEKLHQTLSDTAESCLRRVAEHEQERLAQQYGDPVGDGGEPSQLLMLGLGKLGGREPNYHSDVDVVFLYSDEGETQRRVGGPRKTTNNQHFFNVVAQRVTECVNQVEPNGKLYDLDGRLRPTGSEGVLAVSIESFLKRFRQGVAPLWQRLALCKARSISGAPELRRRTDQAIVDVIAQTAWHDGMIDEIKQLRRENELTAAEDNLKRGCGGTMDVELIAQMLTLRHASQSPKIIHTGTVDALSALAEAGFIDEADAVQLVSSYRVLRRVEGNLRLLDQASRHELPSSETVLCDLAYLMGESDPAMILSQCNTARKSNRSLFEKYMDRK